MKKLTDLLACHDTLKECITCLTPHLSPGIVLENLQLGKDGEHTRILAKGELGSFVLPSLKFGHHINIVK